MPIAEIQNQTSSLRRSPTALDSLREKMFLLWGDLEERKARSATALKPVDSNSAFPAKDEVLRTKPFQCCIKEYGVKKRMQWITEENGSQSEHASEDERVQDRHDWVWERRWRMFGCTIS